MTTSLYLPEDDSIEDTYDYYSVSGSAYASPISDQYVTYFAGLVRKHFFRNYLLFRQDQYDYVLIYNADLTLSGSYVSGSGDAVRIHTGYTGSPYSYTSLGNQSISLNLGSAPAYSDLGHYPSLGGVNNASRGLVVLLALFALIRFVSGFLGR